MIQGAAVWLIVSLLLVFNILAEDISDSEVEKKVQELKAILKEWGEHPVWRDDVNANLVARFLENQQLRLDEEDDDGDGDAELTI